ncbi:MAG: hypothetical protein PUF08_07420 [Clostridiales bacterium]|nr:hypothetical protein [Clostridiales bacterium]
MIDEKTLNEAINIILDRILTPVLYMYEDEALEFICFADSNISDEDFYEAERALYVNLGINAEVIDIRSFDECDRVEITKTAILLYAEDELVKTLIETSISADKERLMAIKRLTVTRKNETGTYYLS